jgi:hypothetical protein
MSDFVVNSEDPIMQSFHRRGFLGSSLGALSAAFAPSRLFGQDKKKKANDGPVKVPDDPPFQPNTLMLTWQRDPTTTMTIQWLGVAGETESTNIQYTEADYEYWEEKLATAKPYPLTDYKVYRCELTGLEPGTDYLFKIGKSSPTWKFRTMPAKANDTIHFITGGDCGVNMHAINSNIVAAKQDPMFALIAGDLGYDNGKAVDVSLAFLRNYSKHMVAPDGRLIPLIATIGNHEVDGGYGKGRDKAPFFYALFDGLYPETGYATLDFGDYLSLVLMDTGHTSKVSGEQTSWLEKVLQEREDHPHVFVVNHVPAYPSHRKAEKLDGSPGVGADQRKYWVPLFDKYRVPVVLEHHDHTFKRTKPLIDGHVHDDGVLYLGDGSWGRLRPVVKAEKLPILARTHSDYHISLQRIEGRERYHLALDETGRIMDLCRTGQRKKGLVSVGG